MGATHFSGPLYVGGVPMVGAQGLITGGNAYFVDPANGSNGNSGLSTDQAVATVAQAYALATANQNDVIYYIGGSTTNAQNATLTWAKSYTHLIGISSPVHTGGRARLEQTTTGVSPLVNVTASGCIFSNIRLIHGAGVGTTDLIALQVTGQRNYFHRIDVAAPIIAAQGDDASQRAVKLDGAAECLFEDCTFGADTIMRSAANATLELDSSATRNKFVRCAFMAAIDAATPVHVKYADTAAVDRYVWFHDCFFSSFSTDHSQVMTKAFSVPASTKTNDIIMTGNNLLSGRITDWGDANSDAIMWFPRATETANVLGFALNPAVT